MGKKGNLGKMKGMLLMALLLFCAFLTGCSLLDIKDGGLGMTNPDYVEPEKDETDEENPENLNIHIPLKKIFTSQQYPALVVRSRALLQLCLGSILNIDLIKNLIRSKKASA